MSVIPRRATLPDKGTAETVDASVNWRTLSNSGSSLSSQVVTAAVADNSETPDPSPSAILDGSPQVDGDFVVQRLTAGVVGATYILTFKFTYANGEIVIEEVALYIAAVIST